MENRTMTIKTIQKTIRIGSQKEWNYNCTKEIQAPVYCRIEYKDAKLSITGVVGPRYNGNCAGSCGQIYDSIDINNYAKSWSKSKVAKFIDIWKEWHLNDICAYTPDMKKAGWDKLASKEIYKYAFTMTSEARRECKELKISILDAATNDNIYKLDDRQKKLLVSEIYKDVYGYKQPEAPEFMELSIHWQTKKPDIETKTLGWTNVEEHKDGLLGRELNGKKYGHSWFKHEVPQDVLQFLVDLPRTDKNPEWI